MSYATLTVYVDVEGKLDGRVSVAADLARRFDAHLIGIASGAPISAVLGEGIVTKFDFLRAFAFTTGQMVPHYDELMKRPVAEVMTEAVVHVEPTAPLTRVLQLMVSLKARSFPVAGAERQLMGIISREDVMRALREATQDAR